MSTLIFTNKDGQNAPFPLDDRIFLGEGLLETLRVMHGKPCYAKFHWHRLKQAAFLLDIPFQISFDLWLKKLLDCIQLESLENGGIKVILSGGRAPRGLVAKSQESCLVFNAFHYVKNSHALKLVSSSWLRDSNNPIYKIKSLNYLEAIIARRQAKSAGVDDVLFYNLKNHATETSIANLFIIKNNQLYTPNIESGILAGIIRQRLLLLSKANGIAYFESALDKEILYQADAIFVCNSLQGICPVVKLDDVSFTTNHSLITLLQDLLAKDSDEDCNLL
ncbi:aminotransferase class IV [Legionella cardiaca]|uniref:branched-chain-amino-acid transaminase n=1 Tax=Legionella cardiaca TaxID=1071983 RepID=A0ABY8ASU3_9GAMM|nr:aminotransferase class IV [Legionella cardiaca]WED43613.1 aminotransferase class IV [Legionella cardiaca]